MRFLDALDESAQPAGQAVDAGDDGLATPTPRKTPAPLAPRAPQIPQLAPLAGYGGDASEQIPGAKAPPSPSAPGFSPLAPAPAPPPPVDPLAFAPAADPGWESPVTPQQQTLGPSPGPTGPSPSLPAALPITPKGPTAPTIAGAGKFYLDNGEGKYVDDPSGGVDTGSSSPPPPPQTPSLPASNAPITITANDPNAPGSGYIGNERIMGEVDGGPNGEPGKWYWLDDGKGGHYGGPVGSELDTFTHQQEQALLKNPRLYADQGTPAAKPTTTPGGGGNIGNPNNLTPSDLTPSIPNAPPTYAPLPAVPNTTTPATPSEPSGAGGGSGSGSAGAGGTGTGAPSEFAAALGLSPSNGPALDAGTPSSGAGSGTASSFGTGSYLQDVTSPAAQYANVFQTDPSNDLRSQTITPGPALDRFKLAQDQLKTFNDKTQPYYDAALRSANQQAAATGRLGSGMLRTSLGDLANQRNLQLETQGQEFLQNALEGSQGDARSNLAALMAEQEYQTRAQNQSFNQNVTGQQLQEQLTNGAFGRGLASLNAGNANDPSSMLMMLSGLYGNQASNANSALAQLIGSTTANNASRNQNSQLLALLQAMGYPTNGANNGTTPRVDTSGQTPGYPGDT